MSQSSTSEPIRAYGPTSAKVRASQTYAEGRVCAEDDCGTILSRHNSEDRCWQHRKRRDIRTRGRKKKAA